MINVRVPIKARLITQSENIKPAEVCTTGKRVFLGNNQNIGNFFSERQTFPFNNVEILTEASERTFQLINRYDMEKNRISYNIPFNIAGNSDWINLPEINREGSFEKPLKIYDDTLSIKLKISVSALGEPISFMNVRMLGYMGSTNIGINGIDDGSLEIRAIFEAADKNFYTIQCKNNNPADLSVIYSYEVITPNN